MNEDAIGGGIGAIFGGYILNKMFEASSTGLEGFAWMPPLLIVLGIFIIIAGIFDIE